MSGLAPSLSRDPRQAARRALQEYSLWLLSRLLVLLGCGLMVWDLASQGGTPWMLGLTAWIIVLSWGVLSRRKHSLSMRLALARVSLVLLAFAVASLEVQQWQQGSASAGVSHVGLLVLLAPALLPSPVRVSLAQCLAIALTVPLAGLLAGHGKWLMGPLAGDALALSIALFPALALAHLKEDTLQAHEMGSYRLIRQIGEGGMGEVWQAQHLHLRRPAAIKFMRSEMISGRDEPAYARFLREGQLLAALQSPHTIQIFDFGRCDDGRLYLVTEFLEGFDLEQLVRRFGPLPPGRVVHLLRQACDSLEEAHALKIVHRDLKPANLFLSYRSGRGDWLKVLDFGLAEQPLGRRPQVPLMGTPEYLSPEQLRGRSAEPRSDIYSLGCVAYFLLSGRVAFARDTLEATLNAQMSEEPAPLPDEVPEALANLVMRCLSKTPARRPRDAKELSHQLAATMPARSWTLRQADIWWLCHNPEKENLPLPEDEVQAEAQVQA